MNVTHIFIADQNNHRIQIFDLKGTYADTIGTGFGSGNDQFNSPVGVEVNASHVFVADLGNNRVQIFDTAGIYADTIAGNGVGGTNNQFSQPADIVLLSNPDRIGVADGGNHRIQFFDPSGNIIGTLGEGVSGSGANQFHLSAAVTHNDTHIFVGDVSNGRIQIFELFSLVSTVTVVQTSTSSITEFSTTTSTITETVEQGTATTTIETVFTSTTIQTEQKNEVSLGWIGILVAFAALPIIYRRIRK